MSSEQVTRGRRVGESVREELASLLAHKVKDPGAKGAIVTRVEMPDDLRSARVLVRLLVGGEDAGCRRALVRALQRASGLLRREITRTLGLRYAPELRFVYDDGADRTTRVEEILAQIEAERRSR
jgi:ribosome-binding factor A